MEDKLVIILNAEDNRFNIAITKLKLEPSIYPMVLIIDWEGIYKQNINKIQKFLNLESRAEIFQLVYFRPNITPTEIKKVTGYAYSLIQRYLKEMKELKLIETNVTQGKLGYEARLNIPKEIKIFKYSEYLEDKDKIINLFKKQEVWAIKKIEKDYKTQIEKKLKKY